MAQRPVKARSQLGALPFALASAVLYAAVAGTAGYLVVDARSPEPTPVAASGSTPSLPPTTTTTTTTTTTAASAAVTADPPGDLPPDLRRVTAPGGLTTVIAAGWQVTTGTVDTTLVATDPRSPRDEVRLGGAPVADPSKPLLDRITEAAEGREREPGHRRLALTATTVRGHPAVGWEFDEEPASGAKRVAAVFWEVAGIEYVLYSAGPPEQWEHTRARLKVMLDHAKP